MYKAKFGQSIFLNLLALAIFWNIKNESYTDEMNMGGALFFLCIDNMMMYVMGTILTF
jgi:hypothetical protein